MTYVNAVIVALAVAAVSFTIAKTKVTAGLRTFVLRRSAYLGAGISCPYCVSHWITLAAVITFKNDVMLLPGHGIFSWMVSWGAIVGASAGWVGVIRISITPTLPTSAPAASNGRGAPSADFVQKFSRVPA